MEQSWPRELDIDPDKTNVNGGATALGHRWMHRLATDRDRAARARAHAKTAFGSMCCGSALGTGAVLERID